MALKLYGKAAHVAQSIVERFREPNRLPAPLARVFIRRKDDVPCRKWSWSNQLLVAIAGYSDARGFVQWQSIGRHVRKGERAVWILAPCIRKVKAESQDGSDEAVSEQSVLYGFRSVPVFGLEQTDGESLATDVEAENWIRSLPLLDVAEHWGLKVASFNGSDGGYLGKYSSAGVIAVGVENLATWCHELVHAADDRLVGLKGGQHLNQETVAELGAAVLLTCLGRNVDADLGGCWHYLQAYAAKHHRQVVDVCLELLQRTCNAVDLILKTAEELQGATLASV